MLDLSKHSILNSKTEIKGANKKFTLIGTSESVDKIRVNFNAMNSDSFIDLIDDFGNIVPEHLDEFCTYLPEIMESQVFLPIIVANEKHFQQLKTATSNENWVSGIVDKSMESSVDGDFNKYIGIQKHFGQGHMIDLNPDQIVKLSEVRYENQKAEVALRNIDTAFIHLDALRYSDNIGHSGSWPAGMTIEEMCQISKYIGASINLKGVIIGGYDENQDIHGVIAKNISLMLWYMLEGYQIRVEESLSNHSDQFNTYSVFTDDLDYELTFRENKRSGRWWIELPYIDHEGNTGLLPCSKEDYEEACVNKISDKILKIYSKI